VNLLSGRSKSRLVFCEIDSKTSVGLFHALNRKQQRLMHLSYPPGNRFNNGFYRRFEFKSISLTHGEVVPEFSC
jgi:hypothetical protein